jgi:hypothetical protein
MKQTSPATTKYIPWIAILTILLTCIAAFGLLLPSLGFYWDDWMIIYLVKMRGLAGLKEQVAYDRPLSLWLYAFTNFLAGISPVKRQMLAFLARLLAVICYWLALGKVFRGKDVPVMWMALLFSVYPLFFQQSIATTYTQPFILYALFSLSLWFMLSGLEHERQFLLYQALGLSAFAANVISAEYFLGLEFIRPLVLWIALRQIEARPRQRLIRLLKIWGPYLILFGGFVVYRLFFLRLPENTNPPVLLFDFIKAPLQTSLVFLQGFVRDFVTVIFNAWQKNMAVNDINFFDRSSLAAWLAGFILAFAVLIIMGHFEKITTHQPAEEDQSTWIYQGLLIGGVAIGLGMLPFWVGGKHLGVGSYSDRVGLPAMFGAAILMVSLAYWFLRAGWQRRLVLSLMVGIAVAAQVRAADGYRLDWENQVRFAWQLHWRAPAIQANTLLVADDSLFRYVTDYSLAAMLSTLYPAGNDTNQFPMWFLEANDIYETRGKNIETFIQGVEIQRDVRSLTFRGSSADSLVVDFHPALHCLWIVGPDDAQNLDLPNMSRSLAPVTNFSRILTSSPESIPPQEIFGTEPLHDWCYYYEKAELARQVGAWPQITSLWDTALQNGYVPAHPYERLIFVEGYARQGYWQEAYDLSRDAFRRQINLQSPLCSLWERNVSNSVQNTQRDELWADLRDRLRCP